MPTHAEVKAVLSVLWHTLSIRRRYEELAMHEEDVMWKNNGGFFPNRARYRSEKWKKMMGPDDPTVQGRRVSEAAMSEARRSFEDSHREHIMFALELAEKIRAEVAGAVEANGPTKHGEYEEQVGTKAWQEIAADPVVREKLARQLSRPPNVSLVRP